MYLAFSRSTLSRSRPRSWRRLRLSRRRTPRKYRFYQYAWYHHLKYAAPKFIGSAKEIQITTATAGVRKEQPKFSHAVNDVAQQTMQDCRWKSAFCPSMADPMLHYCTCAIQRK
jgi:hypothetical protein